MGLSSLLHRGLGASAQEHDVSRLTQLLPVPGAGLLLLLLLSLELWCCGGVCRGDEAAGGRALKAGGTRAARLRKVPLLLGLRALHQSLLHEQGHHLGRDAHGEDHLAVRRRRVAVRARALGGHHSAVCCGRQALRAVSGGGLRVPRGGGCAGLSGARLVGRQGVGVEGGPVLFRRRQGVGVDGGQRFLLLHLPLPRPRPWPLLQQLPRGRHPEVLYGVALKVLPGKVVLEGGIRIL